MEFKYALYHICLTQTWDNVPSPFQVYCQLSDMCTSFEDKQKVEQFYQINKATDLLQKVINGRKRFYNEYKQVADIVSEDVFNGFVADLLDIVNLKVTMPGVTKESSAELLQKVRDIIEKNNRKSELNQNYGDISSNDDDDEYSGSEYKDDDDSNETEYVDDNTESEYVERDRSSVATQSIATDYTYSGSYSSFDFPDALIWGGIIFAVLAVLGLIATIVCACVLHWPWIFWQWFIGAGGSIVLLAIAFGLVKLDFAYINTIFFLALTVANITLRFIYPAQYNILFYWFFGVIILFGAHTTWDDFITSGIDLVMGIDVVLILCNIVSLFLAIFL